jgi:hypothetical protein
MKTRRLAAVLSGFAIVAATPMAASAAPAPPGSAEAAVAQIGSLIGISTTSAQVGPDGSSAGAVPVSVNGQPLFPQSGHAGSLIDTGSTPVGHVQVAPWSTATSADHAEGDAAIARANVADLANVHALQSHSEADWSETNSSGASSSDGARVQVDGLDVVLLHSHGNSAGESGSFAAGVNDTEVLTSDDAAEACAANVDVLDLNCLAASGGPDSVLASVADATLGGSYGLPEVGVVTAGASGSEAAITPETPLEPETPTGPRGVLNESSSRNLGSAADPSGTLPFTGANVGTIFLMGLVFIGLGGAVLATRRPWASRSYRGQLPAPQGGSKRLAAMGRAGRRSDAVSRAHHPTLVDHDHGLRERGVTSRARCLPSHCAQRSGRSTTAENSQGITVPSERRRTRYVPW